jgi:hypothetical protein
MKKTIKKIIKKKAMKIKKRVSAGDLRSEPFHDMKWSFDQFKGKFDYYC